MKNIRENLFPYLVGIFPLLLPLYLLKGDFFGFPVTFPELILAALFIVFIFHEQAWKKSFWKDQLARLPKTPILLFLIAAVVSTMMVPEFSNYADGTLFGSQQRALGILKGWVLAPMIYFFMARYYFYHKPSLVKVALNALMLSGVILSAYGIFQFFTGTATTPDGRISGPFESANYLSLYLGPITLYGFILLFVEKFKSNEWYANLIAFLILGFALILTASYASWIGVIVAALFWFYHQRIKIPQSWLKWLIGLAAIVFVVTLASQMGTDKFSSFMELSERSSSSVRLQVYEVSFGMIKQFPLLGAGLGQYEVLYQEYAPEILGHAPFEWVMLHPHNIVLAFWLNMGLLGLFASGWLVYLAFTWLKESDKHRRYIAAYMLLSLVVHGIFDTPYFKNDLAFEFWLLLAILL